MLRRYLTNRGAMPMRCSLVWMSAARRHGEICSGRATFRGRPHRSNDFSQKSVAQRRRKSTPRAFDRARVLFCAHSGSDEGGNANSSETPPHGIERGRPSKKCSHQFDSTLIAAPRDRLDCASIRDLRRNVRACLAEARGAKAGGHTPTESAEEEE
jgi:hypothetical protein